MNQNNNKMNNNIIITYNFSINGEVIINSLSMKGAQKLLLRKYNECFIKKRKFAKNWGIAVNKSKNKEGARKTTTLGQRKFFHNGDIYEIKVENNCTDTIAERLNTFIGKDGFIYFEHGFKKPIIKIDGNEINVHCVSQNEIKTTYNYYYPFNLIEDKQLEKLFKEIVRYVDYVVNEA